MVIFAAAAVGFFSGLDEVGVITSPGCSGGEVFFFLFFSLSSKLPYLSLSSFSFFLFSFFFCLFLSFYFPTSSSAAMLSASTTPVHRLSSTSYPSTSPFLSLTPHPAPDHHAVAVGESASRLSGAPVEGDVREAALRDSGLCLQSLAFRLRRCHASAAGMHVLLSGSCTSVGV